MNKIPSSAIPQVDQALEIVNAYRYLHSAYFLSRFLGHMLRPAFPISFVLYLSFRRVSSNSPGSGRQLYSVFVFPRAISDVTRTPP